jgi:hypothetical protein
MEIREYQGKEILGLLISVLADLNRSSLKEENWNRFLEMDVADGYNESKVALKDKEEFHKKAMGNPTSYFWDEVDYYRHLVGLDLIKALDKYFSRLKEEKEMPVLTAPDYYPHRSVLMDLGSPFAKWIKQME